MNIFDWAVFSGINRFSLHFYSTIHLFIEKPLPFEGVFFVRTQ